MTLDAISDYIWIFLGAGTRKGQKVVVNSNEIYTYGNKLRPIRFNSKNNFFVTNIYPLVTSYWS